MIVLINALSVDNPSGRSVLRGHLRQWLSWQEPGLEFVVLYRSGNADLVEDYGEQVRWHLCRMPMQNWAARACWQRLFLAGVAYKLDASVCLTMSGIAADAISLPQIVVAQNPWCLVPEIHQTGREKWKAKVQRLAYRRTMLDERVTMFFVSDYLRRAYANNAGVPARGELLGNGLENGLLKNAVEASGFETKRDGPLLCVSVFGRHKNVEALLKACTILRERGESRSLELIGSWPDEGYRQQIVAEIERAEMSHLITVRGYVSRSELIDAYCRASVFVLLSRCESFGIPAVEAQAFGTPVVTSNCCAIPEICADGGFFVDPDDAAGAADQIAKLLGDEQEWQACSQRARDNSARFHWNDVSLPMRDAFRRFKASETASGDKHSVV